MREVLEIKEPQASQVPKNEGVIIVTMNPVGTSCHQDGGREAQQMADTLGVVVIAADRPTNFWPNIRLRSRLRDNPVEAHTKIARKIDKAVSQYGRPKVIMAGKSGGAIGVLEVAMTQIVSGTEYIYTAEAAGSNDIPDGAIKYYANALGTMAHLQRADYEQAKLSDKLQLIYPFQDYKHLSLREKISRTASIPTLYFNDAFYNTYHWNQPLALDYYEHIVTQFGIRTDADYAEHSMVLSPVEAQREATIDRLTLLQTQFPELFGLEIVPNTIHSSFDRRPWYNQRLAGKAGPDLLPLAA